jgi:hypothetical protein
MLGRVLPHDGGVVAMDGFSYQRSSLEEYIAHCAATGQALTSPLSGELMGGT